MSKKRLLIIFFICFLGLIIIIFFLKNNYKNSNLGNNITKITLDKSEEYIFNINSYEALMEVTVNSNKNTNKYLIKQIVNNNELIQEIIEPDNLKGMKFSYSNGNLIIENTSLNLQKIYENYPYISENSMFLSDFINKYKEYKKDGKVNIIENEEDIVFTINCNDKYVFKEELYINKNTGKPEKMIVQNNNQKESVYIQYKETKMNNL